MLKVLALVTEAYGGRGGIAQYNRDFLGELAEHGASIEILPRYVSEESPKLPRRTCQHPPRSGRLSYSLAAWRAVSQFRPDMIFCGHLFMARLAELLAGRSAARLVFQCHGIEAWKPPANVSRSSIENADLVLCVSRYTRSRLLDWAEVPSERAVVLPNTIAHDCVPVERATARSSWDITDDALVLLSVGRLDPSECYKGHDRVISLLSRLSTNGRPLLYIIAGDGDDASRLQRLAEDKGVSDQVRFERYVSRGRLSSLYSAADLFVLPSTGEGFGIVYLEAMACGTPALGLAAGGARDALVDGELGYAPRLGDLAEALQAAILARPPDPKVLSDAVQMRFGRPVFSSSVERVLKRLSTGRPAYEGVSA